MDKRESKQNLNKKFAKNVGIVIGVIVGYVLGSYTGIYFLIPMIGALLGGWMISKVAKETSRAMIAAFAIQAGHFFWFLFPLVLIKQVNLDLVVILGGLIWLMTRPGLYPVIFLTIYQIVCILINLSHFILAEFGSGPHRALLMHIILRVSAVLFMIIGLRKIHNQKASAAQVMSNKLCKFF